LTWLSSGLETALFNLCFTLWIYWALQPSYPQVRAWLFWLSSSATLTALARPDGLLTVVATIALLGLARFTHPEPASAWLKKLPWAAPLLGTVVHLLWRHSTYGEWLPNSYYAKQVRPWPESGLRYAASFILDYAVWVWIALAFVWLIKSRRISRQSLIVAGVLAAHFAYYTFYIGGDHFEYRVYSHLVLLFLVSFIWFGARLDLSFVRILCFLGFYLCFGWLLPWTHYVETKGLNTRAETTYMFRPLGDRFPPILRLYAAAFDNLQAWLIKHAVCMRHQEHKIYYEYMTRTLPSREEGAQIEWDGYPVHVSASVGVVGWVLPNVAVIDKLGLNDYVIARTPVFAPNENRIMAHDRRSPPGYVECFRANVVLSMEADQEKTVFTEVERLGTPATRRQIALTRRDTSLSAENIRACEAYYVHLRALYRKK
jgi:arabinofuranosyltransferase